MPPVLFHSTNGQSSPVNFREALMAGQAPDRGLYFPREFPRLEADEIASFSNLAYHEIATRVLSPYLEGILEEEVLAELCRDVYTFDVPLQKAFDRVHLMRLDRGPTASFKDFAAQMMGRLMGRFVQEEDRQLTILTATSGDTGSAVAHAFHNVPGTRVIVLFPEAEISARQRKLMTVLTGNVTSIAIDGKFDDCQAMVKRAFADRDLSSIPLSSANSINIGRLLPQSVYYFYAASRLTEPAERMVFSVPSGNFGDMMGGVVAREMGLPLKKLIASVNDNDAFPRFLETGTYKKIEPSRNSISNAMNVGHPSNLARLVAVYGGHMDETGRLHKAPDLQAMRRDIFSSSVSDERTRLAFLEFYEKYDLLLEPHGAVGWQGLKDWMETESLEGAPAVLLETADPAKFPELIEAAFGWSPDAPESMTAMDNMSEQYERMTTDYDRFKEFLAEQHA
jgi:threonine synthase